MRRLLRDSAKVLFITCALIIFFEVVLRLAASAWYQTQYYLFYGFHNWVGKVGINPWSTVQGAYYKFPPNYILKGAAGSGQGLGTASIIPTDFAVQILKPLNLKGSFELSACASHPPSGFGIAIMRPIPLYWGGSLRNKSFPWKSAMRDFRTTIVVAFFLALFPGYI